MMLLKQNPKTHSLSTVSLAAPFPLPDVRFWPGPLRESMRRRIMGVLAVVGIAAVVTYVGAVNAILLDGEQVRKGTALLDTLKQEREKLADEAARQQSPLWLGEQAQREGMVAANDIRHLVPEQPIALSSNHSD